MFNSLLRKLHVTARQPKAFAFAFDVDGVLIKGEHVLPEARRALQLLNGENSLGRRIPFILLTNGGGTTEERKAEQLSEMLGVHISPHQLVLSHSPMKALVPFYENTPVLVVGGADHSCREVAERYGFRRVVRPNDILSWEPAIWPFRVLSTVEQSEAKNRFEFPRERIGAVMVFHDSRDCGHYCVSINGRSGKTGVTNFEFLSFLSNKLHSFGGRDLQIIIDVLRSQDGILGTVKPDFSVQSIPLYFSNPDIIWSTNFPIPRFAQGSFRLALETLYSQHTGGQRLHYTLFGKPQPTTYQYAEKLLDSFATTHLKDQSTQRRRVYAVGDNPAADIAGANAHGWTSLLVKTGVFSGLEGENSPEHPADVVVENVEEAVRWVLEREERAQ